MFNWM